MEQIPNYQNLQVTAAGGIAEVTICRPQVMNALNNETYRELADCFGWIGRDPDIRVAILTGAGEKAFAAGADIAALAKATGIGALTSYAKQAMLSIENCSKPVIAAVNGVAFGGGCEVTLACDVRIVAETALIGLPETSLGLLPGAGGTQRLARLVGMSVAKAVILAGKNLTAQEAVSCGLAIGAVPPAQLMEEARKLASGMIKRGPLALAIAKQAVNRSLSADLDTGLYLESLAFSVLMETQDKREGTQAFAERRPAKFQGK